jgi:CubicO group peptidase (beta-lactamase class C family)
VGYWLLGFVIERASGTTYADRLRERVLRPLGLRSTSFCPREDGEAVGYAIDSGRFVVAPRVVADWAWSAGGLCSTAGDLVTWTRALASGKVVSRASYEAMTTPVALRSPRPMNYGFGLLRDSIGSHRVVHHGGASQGVATRVAHFPDDSLVVVVLANTGRAPEKLLADNIARAVLGIPLVRGPAPLADVPTTPAERAALVGRYRVAQPDGTRRDATVEDVDGRLTIRVAGRVAPLQRQHGHVYVMGGAPPNQRVLFDVRDGRATGFILDHSLRPVPATRAP